MSRRGPRAARRAGWAALLLLTGAAHASAQADVSPARQPAGPPRVEVSLLGLLATGGDLGSSEATLLGNSSPAGSPTPLFTSRTRLAAAPLGEVRAGVRLARGWLAEVGVSYGRPVLEVRLTNDIEDAPDVTATSRLTQLVVDGALVHRWQRGRLSPFVIGGAGYLRQLDEPRTTVGTGQVYAGGGGLLVGIGRSRPDVGYRFQVRGDVRVVGYRGGLLLADDRPVGVVAGVGLTLRIR